MLLSCYCNTIDDAYVLNIVTDKFKECVLFPCVAIYVPVVFLFVSLAMQCYVAA